jgi:hypothetical protein
MLEQFTGWLEATTLSATLQEVSWAIPLLQTIHILGIAAVFSSVCLISTRLAGFNRQASAEELLRGNLRLFWPALLILLLSGGLLVVSEPGRDLLNPMFQIKMAVLIGGIAFVVASKKRLLDHGFEGLEFKLDGGVRKSIAIIIVVIFVAIIGFGRWIAYFDAGTI